MALEFYLSPGIARQGAGKGQAKTAAFGLHRKEGVKGMGKLVPVQPGAAVMHRKPHPATVSGDGHADRQADTLLQLALHTVVQQVLEYRCQMGGVNKDQGLSLSWIKIDALSFRQGEALDQLGGEVAQIDTLGFA
jgi:hypothetical protein